MECPKCLHENPDYARFCNRCAQELIPASGASSPSLSFDEKINKIQRYLPEGLIEKILSQKEKIEGERKQVTVMFCDMERFTNLVEKLGSEKSYSVMDEIYDILIHNVHSFEGTINEMTGDGIMALFGAPIALEDAPQRALRSALSIHSEIEDFNRRREDIGPIKMRIGVHTGLVVVGTLGNDLRVEFKAVGDTVNLASRMETLAEPGTTYVTEDTFKLTKELFRFETLGEKAVKGKEEDIPVYKLLLAKEDVHRPRIGLERSIYSEMVGRDKELDKLELQVLKAVNGEGSIVNIIGEAGIGKSRLIAELKNREVMKRVSLFEGRAISTGRNLSFHPIIYLLKYWAHIGEDDIGTAALSKLEKAVNKVIPERKHEVLPFVAKLMGMKLPGRYAERLKGIEGEALEKLIVKNMRDLIIKATELKPHVIVMEDLHWADTSSIELMEPLFRLAETQRIVFINVFRPGHKETGDRIVETIKERLPVYYVEINLQPLDGGMSETLINNMLQIKGLKHAIIDQIVERADGNPFFIEEVVRSLIDHGAVVQKEGVFEVTQKIDTMVIPHSINDVLMARIDRLNEKTRHLVKVASIIGRNFFYRILKDITEQIEDIDNRLNYLKEIQLIRERRRMEEIEFLFKHALAQEAAYESTLLKKRKALHIRVAQSIEKIFKERLHEFYGMLAYHYSCGENEDKAEEYLLKAGEEALLSSASSEAIHYYEEALRIFLKRTKDVADPKKRAMIEKNIAIALYNKGRFSDSVLYIDKTLAFYGEKAPTNPFSLWLTFIMNALAFIANLYLPRFKSGDFPTEMDNEIIHLLYKKLSALAVTDPKKMFVYGLYLFRKIRSFDVGHVRNGLAYLMSESPFMSWSGVSFRLAHKALQSVKDKVEKDDVRVLLYYKGAEILYIALGGDWGKEREFDEGLVDASAEIGEFFWASIYTYWYGYLDVERGHFKAAQDKIGKLSDLADSYDNNYSRILKYALNSVFLTKCRKYSEAVITSEEGFDFGVKAGLGIWSFSILSMKARVHSIFDEPGEAEVSLSRASQLKSEINIVPFYLCNFFLSQFTFDILQLRKSMTSQNEADLIEARKRVIKSGRKALAASRKAAPERTETYRLMGTYFWIIGKQKRSLKWWNKSIKESESLGARLELSRTYFEIARRLLERKSKYKELNGIKVDEYLNRAKTIFQEMDLQWDLDELDKIAEDV